MKRKIKGKIFYMVDKGHPDYQHIKNPDEVQEFDDIYILDGNYFCTLADCKHCIKRDLSLIAGGGYNTEHIHNVKFEFETLA